MSSEFWYEIAIAFCLVMILEGIVPFLYPHRWRGMVEQLANIDNSRLRIIGLLSMLAGVLGLYLIH
ncbi:DUF2065 domain-containing protein [Neptunomonas sp.]|uniref:DUF2065 domain-containing protein n=1 Tax=Neptunomonas sp. TaxID=1971898 RepID=UPI0025F6AD14|nr:DUF2065 domain-containing protein [Neptunomonas sp.]